MYRCVLRILTVSALVLGAACATDPENRSSADGHYAAMRTHLEFARDFKEAGNDAMSQYHFEKAAIEDEQRADAECGLFCTIIEELLDSGPDSSSRGSCRDPITSPPSGPPRC
jgi:Tfp pilus assembly protein PilF